MLKIHLNTTVLSGVHIPVFRLNTAIFGLTAHMFSYSVYIREYADKVKPTQKNVGKIFALPPFLTWYFS